MQIGNNQYWVIEKDNKIREPTDKELAAMLANEKSAPPDTELIKLLFENGLKILDCAMFCTHASSSGDKPCLGDQLEDIALQSFRTANELAGMSGRADFR